MEKPQELYWSVLSNGKLALLNYDDDPADARLANGRRIRIEPYRIVLQDLR
jgi:hypothetical protein